MVNYPAVGLCFTPPSSLFCKNFEPIHPAAELCFINSHRCIALFEKAWLFELYLYSLSIA